MWLRTGAKGLPGTWYATAPAVDVKPTLTNNPSLTRLTSLQYGDKKNGRFDVIPTKIT